MHTHKVEASTPGADIVHAGEKSVVVIDDRKCTAGCPSATPASTPQTLGLQCLVAEILERRWHICLAVKGVLVTMVVRKSEVADSINNRHINSAHQSDLVLPDQVSATTDAAEGLKDVDFIFHAVPVQFSRDYLNHVAHLMPADVPVVSLSKGIETSTLCLMCDVLAECLGEERPIAVLSGPAFAGEIAAGLATAVTVACVDRDLANDLMELLATTNFRALYSPDVIGVEVGGAVKNVIAIAAGMCEGLGLGTNAMAALVTRGCSEMRRLVSVCGGEPATVFGLSGVGDTFGTCFGPLSRNRQVGLRLGRGEALSVILGSSSEVAEGVATAQAITALVNQKAVDYSRPTLELTTHLLYRLQWGGEELRIYTTTHFNFKLSDFLGQQCIYQNDIRRFLERIVVFEQCLRDGPNP
eukprot:CAMPEP_0119403512 /NCGR_PEP_ID=MMETSP1334-20130426/143420_1 /TAXON_ID=127549 /ORGANISM="Calcidiscus leptoporus, Strain RCC1130" /LENGTH=412 /DNA_ID=CAMNT_0007427459 /DNA_START=159 /DNA_END=1397 /DNA_ORIENTATION=+